VLFPVRVPPSLMRAPHRFRKLDPSAQQALLKDIGEKLRAEYSTLSVPMPERLAKLLVQLEQEFPQESQARQEKDF